MLDFLTGQQHFKVLESALGVSSLRHKVISNNIANIDTPKFKRSEVAFESYLKDYLDNIDRKETSPEEKRLSLTTTNRRHIVMPQTDGNKEPFLGATVRTVDELTMRTDGNNVDIDVEMADMAKNTIYYQAVSQRVGSYFTSLRSVIEGR